MIATPQMLTVHIPLTVRRRGGRKVVIAPDGTEAHAVSATARIDSTLVKALARAFRWRRMLESGRYATIDELAAAEKINGSYVSRILRLSLLAPEIVEAILDGRQSTELTLPVLIKAFPVGWGVARQSGWRSATIRMTFGNRDELIIRRRSDGGKCYVGS